MSPVPVPRDVVFFTSAAEFRDWLREHHATADEVWVGMRSKASGQPTLTWSDAVDEALCAGWIDSVTYAVEGGRAQRFTPRRPRSMWSARNIERVAALTAEGRMLPAGLAAFERRDPARSGYTVGGPERLPPAYEQRFRAHPDAWAFFERQPPGYRRNAIGWVVDAKREATRERRLGRLIEDSAAGRRLAQFP